MQMALVPEAKIYLAFDLKSCPNCLQSIYRNCNMVICIKSIDSAKLFCSIGFRNHLGEVKTSKAYGIHHILKFIIISLKKKLYNLNFLNLRRKQILNCFSCFYFPPQDITYLDLIKGSPNTLIVWKHNYDGKVGSFFCPSPLEFSF